MAKNKKSKGLGGLILGLTLGIAGALAATFFGKKENRKMAFDKAQDLKNKGKKLLKRRK
jgi:hypothetical protein